MVPFGDAALHRRLQEVLIGERPSAGRRSSSMTIEIFLHSRDVPMPDPSFSRRNARLQPVNRQSGRIAKCTNAQKISHLGYPLCTEPMPAPGMAGTKLARRCGEASGHVTQAKPAALASRSGSHPGLGDELGVEVPVHRLGAALRSVAGILDAAERHFGQGEAKAVDRDHAGFDGGADRGRGLG